MTYVKAYLQHAGQHWNGIFSFLRSRQVQFANHGNDGGFSDGGDTSNSDYDELKNVKIHEVTRAKTLILPQLRDDVCLYDIQPNFICDLYLDNSLAECPSEIFGRVIDKYPPFDPQLQYPLEYVDLQVPRKGRSATIVQIPAKIIRSYPAPSSWYIKVPFWTTSMDLADLEGYVDIFASYGIHIDIHQQPEDLRLLYNFSIKNRLSVPCMLVISSDWLSSLDPHNYEIALYNLKLLLIEMNACIINYHPRTGIVLNEVAHYIYRRSKHYFLDAYSMQNLMELVGDELDHTLSRPL